MISAILQAHWALLKRTKPKILWSADAGGCDRFMHEDPPPLKMKGTYITGQEIELSLCQGLPVLIKQR